MKSIDDARRHVQAWLKTHLSSVVAGVEPSPWTTGRIVPLLGSVPKTELQQQWSRYQAWAQSWFGCPLPAGVDLEEVARRVGSSDQPLPARLVFTDVEAMCRFARNDWPTKLRDQQGRWQEIRARFPAAPDPHGVLRRTRHWHQVEVTTLLDVAQWFQANPHGFQDKTPRQIPVSGVHGKWLNATSRLKEVTALTGIGPIRLPGRPPTIRFTYCDPAHEAAGGRRHDTWVHGDITALAYTPTTVLIVENQDTYFYFPSEAGLIVVWGVGDMAPARLAGCDWIKSAPHVFYWGDIDADGFRILDALRSRVPQTQSILMDMAAFEQFEVHGTNSDRANQPIKPGLKWVPASLTNDELDVLRRISAEDHLLHRRIEQERIPLTAALEAMAVAGTSPRGDALL